MLTHLFIEFITKSDTFWFLYTNSLNIDTKSIWCNLIWLSGMTRDLKYYYWRLLQQQQPQQQRQKSMNGRTPMTPYNFMNVDFILFRSNGCRWTYRRVELAQNQFVKEYEIERNWFAEGFPRSSKTLFYVHYLKFKWSGNVSNRKVLMSPTRLIKRKQYCSLILFFLSSTTVLYAAFYNFDKCVPIIENVIIREIIKVTMGLHGLPYNSKFII